MDTILLKNTFTKFGFDIDIHENKNKQTVFAKLAYTAEQRLKDYNSVVVCMLSHGANGYYIDCNDEIITVYDVQMALNSRACPAMHGKPKIFILGACRRFTRNQSSISATGHLPDNNNPVDYEDTELNMSPVSDIFLISSTYEGTLSYGYATGMFVDHKYISFNSFVVDSCGQACYFF